MTKAPSSLPGGALPALGAGPDRMPASHDSLARELFPPLTGRVTWGLTRIHGILAGIGHPLRRVPVLHVGGTNGKGSVGRVWAGILEEAGLRVGLYSSPDLVSFRERILVNGRPFPDEALLELAQELHPHLLRESPSLFEASTALAFLAMERAGVELAVVEVGLGGRLDATNVVSPVVSVITNVTMDHADLLGGTLPEIALEKAGILKAGVPAYTGSQDPAVLEVLTREAATLGVPLTRVGPPRGTVTAAGISLSVRTRRWGELELKSPLVGRHQLENVALAVRSLEALPPRIPITATCIRKGVARARLPGRFQVERTDAGLWVLDVAHNPAAARVLVSTLQEVELPAPRIGVVQIMKDKDVPAILKELAQGLDGMVLVTDPSTPEDRRWEPGEAELALPRGFPTRKSDSVAEGLEQARTWAERGGSVLVTGSFSVVALALRALDRIPREALPPSSGFG